MQHRTQRLSVVALGVGQHVECTARERRHVAFDAVVDEIRRREVGRRYTDRVRRAEIGEQRAAVVIEQDVRRLDIGMHEAMAVYRLERSCDRHDHARDFGGSEGTVRRHCVFEGGGGEGCDQPRIARGGALDELDDVRMAQAPQHLDLASQCVGAGRVVGDLDGYSPCRAPLLRDEDHGVFGASDNGVELVADGECCRVVGSHAALSCASSSAIWTISHPCSVTR